MINSDKLALDRTYLKKIRVCEYYYIRVAKISRSLSSICMSAWEGAELVSEETSARAISVLLSWWRRSLRKEEYVWGTGVDMVVVLESTVRPWILIAAAAVR
jgi:hypothetical protein